MDTTLTYFERESIADARLYNTLYYRWAMWWRSKGYNCIPVSRDSKNPLPKKWVHLCGSRSIILDELTIAQWANKWRDANPAYLPDSSHTTRLVVVDVDDPSQWVIINKLFPQTHLKVTTGRKPGCAHLVFQAPRGVEVHQVTGIINKVDIKSYHNFLVSPGAIHASGATYETNIDLDNIGQDFFKTLPVFPMNVYHDLKSKMVKKIVKRINIDTNNGVATYDLNSKGCIVMKVPFTTLAHVARQPVDSYTDSPCCDPGKSPKGQISSNGSESPSLYCHRHSIYVVVDHKPRFETDGDAKPEIQSIDGVPTDMPDWDWSDDELKSAQAVMGLGNAWTGYFRSLHRSAYAQAGKKWPMKQCTVYYRGIQSRSGVGKIHGQSCNDLSCHRCGPQLLAIKTACLAYGPVLDGTSISPPISHRIMFCTTIAPSDEGAWIENYRRTALKKIHVDAGSSGKGFPLEDPASTQVASERLPRGSAWMMFHMGPLVVVVTTVKVGKHKYLEIGGVARVRDWIREMTMATYNVQFDNFGNDGEEPIVSVTGRITTSRTISANPDKVIKDACPHGWKTKADLVTPPKELAAQLDAAPIVGLNYHFTEEVTPDPLDINHDHKPMAGARPASLATEPMNADQQDAFWAVASRSKVSNTISASIFDQTIALDELINNELDW